ncbi:MAG: ABC transporter permease [Thermomicrobiales bacterium]
MSRLAVTLSSDAGLEQTRLSNPRRLLWRRLRRTPAVVIGLSVVVGLTICAVFAPLLAPADPLYQNYSAVLQDPVGDHLLGTDNLGRDILSRLLYGTRTSLLVGVVAVGIATVIGVAMGLIAGYVGGWVDDLLMRISDALFAFPALLLILAIASALGPSILNTMAAIGIVFSPSYARMIRGEVLTLRERDFVIAARALGAGDTRIMLRHILPNGLSPIIILASLSVSGAILTEATLSFLGVGTPPPNPSWGSMLQNGYQYLQIAPWLSIFPGVAIFVSVLAFNLLGDGLRTVLDPRLRT